MSGNVTTTVNRKESLTTIHKSAITDHVVDKNHHCRWARQIQTLDIRGYSYQRDRDEGQYFLPKLFDEMLMKKHPIGRSFGNTQNIARRQSYVSSQWWLRKELFAETYTVSAFFWIRTWKLLFMMMMIIIIIIMIIKIIIIVIIIIMNL